MATRDSPGGCYNVGRQWATRSILQAGNELGEYRVRHGYSRSGNLCNGRVYRRICDKCSVEEFLSFDARSAKDYIMATESTEGHEKINALIGIFPRPSVDSVAIK